MLVTLFGICTLVRDSQQRNALSPIAVYPYGITHMPFSICRSLSVKILRFIFASLLLIFPYQMHGNLAFTIQTVCCLIRRIKCVCILVPIRICFKGSYWFSLVCRNYIYHTRFIPCAPFPYVSVLILFHSLFPFVYTRPI